MSANVDVLAVMDAQIAARDAINASLGGTCCVTNDLREARAAVADLIEAAKVVERNAVRHDGDDRMFNRLFAALARVGGAA